MKPSFAVAALLSLLSVRVAAQTYTACSPLNSTCPPDQALGTSFNQTFEIDSSLSSTYWKNEAGTIAFGPSGAIFTIAQHGDAPTIASTFAIFWGRVEVIMRAASGQGIISSIVLLSDDLDEIDWEIMGGNTTHVETNYFGKGNITQENALYYPCDNPQGALHNYTTVWSSEQIEYHLDNKIVRTVPYGSAVDSAGKTMYPQTPTFLKIGSWAAGDPTEPLGTRQWAGGLVDYNDGPFDMYVKSVHVVDGTNNAKSYTYGDHSGSWQSIEIERGISSVAVAIHAPPPLTLTQRWNNLSSAVQITIICVIAGVVALLFGLFVFYCIRQRRAGKRERAAADAAWDQEQAELLEYKRRMQMGQFGRKGGGFVGVVQQQQRWH